MTRNAYRPHTFVAGPVRHSARDGWYSLCAVCRGTADARFLVDDTAVHPAERPMPAWVRRAIGLDPTGARLPASDRTAGR